MVGICLALLANMSWADNSPADHVLKSNLAYGEMIELNQYSPGQPKGLMLRLFPPQIKMKPAAWKPAAHAKTNT